MTGTSAVLEVQSATTTLRVLGKISRDHSLVRINYFKISHFGFDAISGVSVVLETHNDFVLKCPDDVKNMTHSNSLTEYSFPYDEGILYFIALFQPFGWPYLLRPRPGVRVNDQATYSFC